MAVSNVHLRDRVVFGIVLLFGCLLSGAGNEQQHEAQVGGTIITVEDVSNRIKTEQAYGNKEFKKPVALITLINESVESEVARIHNVMATRQEIEAFSKHADETTKAPEILNKVKKVFENNRQSYERLFLAPKIVSRKIRVYFSRNAELHKKEQQLIEKAYGFAASGSPLKEAASLTGLEYAAYDVEDKVLQPAAELQPYMEAGAEDTDPLIAILEPLAPGALYDHIVESDQDYRVVRFLARDGKKYSVEAVIARKRPFDDWFREEAAKLKIEITDPKLKESIKKSYPDLWWVKNL